MREAPRLPTPRLVVKVPTPFRYTSDRGTMKLHESSGNTRIAGRRRTKTKDICQ